MAKHPRQNGWMRLGLKLCILSSSNGELKLAFIASISGSLAAPRKQLLNRTDFFGISFIICVCQRLGLRFHSGLLWRPAPFNPWKDAFFSRLSKRNLIKNVLAADEMGINRKIKAQKSTRISKGQQDEEKRDLSRGKTLFNKMVQRGSLEKAVEKLKRGGNALNLWPRLHVLDSGLLFSLPVPGSRPVPGAWYKNPFKKQLFCVDSIWRRLIDASQRASIISGRIGGSQLASLPGGMWQGGRPGSRNRISTHFSAVNQWPVRWDTVCITKQSIRNIWETKAF